MKRRTSIALILSHAFLGVGFFFIYVHHVRTVFESKTNYGQLSKLGRESLLRGEDALYYSFYKIITEDHSFENGYNKILNLTTIEYPNVVNSVHRFHILPEIFVSYIYHRVRDLSKFLHIPTVSCWTSEADDGIPIMMCDGMGDPFHFYLEFVWSLGGLTVFILYMYGSLLSENSFGGIHAVVLYIIFHKYASKIYERPAARENFAFPFIFWQMFYLNLCLEKISRVSLGYYSMISRFFMVAKFTFLTTLSILCWQFASVIFTIQVIILIIPQSSTVLTSLFCIDYAASQFLSNIIAFYFMYDNKKFLLSWQNGPSLALLCFSIKNIYRIRKKQELLISPLKHSVLGLMLAFSMQGTITDILEKSGYTHSDDNPYTVYRDLILYWGLQRRLNFSTTLLACKEDFGAVDLSDYSDLINALFVKPLCLYGVVLLAQFLRKWRRSTAAPEDDIDKIERAKKYVLEDFLEEKLVSMKEISNKETEKELTICLNLLKDCNYDYEKYKLAKLKAKPEHTSEHDRFISDVRKLKSQINKTEQRKDKAEVDPEHEGNTGKASSEPGEETAKPSEEEIINNSNSGKKTTNVEKKLALDANYHYWYSVTQFLIFIWIGVTVKKLFFLCYTQGCVLAPTVCAKFWYRTQTNIFWTVSLIVFLTSIFDPGVQNFEKEYLPSIPGADDLEIMLEWINLNTEKDAVFAGPIEVIATVHLATGRPIVNHPVLETSQMSDRTEAVYSVFSRQQSSDIYNQCSQLKIQYVIVSLDKCTNSTEDECSILSIWDEMQPSQRKHSQFCAELINKNVQSFLKVFSDGQYGIIKMFSQSVQLDLKYNRLPERDI